MGKGTKQKSIFREDPYLIPGYAGHFPQYKFTEGGTFAQLTQNLYRENAWDSKQKILSPVGIDEFHHEAVRDSLRLLKKEPRLAKGELKYVPDMKAGYAGIIPFSADKSGKPYPIQSLLALAEFEENQRKYNQYQTNLKLMVDIQEGKINPENVTRGVSIPPRMFRYGAPIDKFQANPDVYKPLNKRLYSISIYDMDNDDPNKYVMSGFAGHIPVTQEICGKTNKEATHEALNQFRNGRPFFKPVAPDDTLITVKTPKIPEPPIPVPRTSRTLDQKEKEKEEEKKLKTKEFPVELGFMPHYAGHMPGFIHLCGLNFGAATKELVRRGCLNPLKPRRGDPGFIKDTKDFNFPYFTRKHYF